MGSTNNTWIEPIGYTSSFRAVRTPLRLTYGRNDTKYAKIKETGGENFRKQNKGRESTPRTFPMELRSRDVIISEVASLKRSKYSRSRSTPREVLGLKEAIIPEVSSAKKLKYNRCHSTPKEVSKPYSDIRRSPRKRLPRFSEPFQNTESRHSESFSKTPLLKGKNTPEKRSSTPRREPLGYIHSSQSAPKRAPLGYLHASSSTPNRASSGYRYSSPGYRQEADHFAPRAKSDVSESSFKKDSKSAGLKHEQRPGKRNSPPTSSSSRHYSNNGMKLEQRPGKRNSPPTSSSSRHYSNNGMKLEQRPGKRNSSPTSFNSRHYSNKDESPPRRFLRSHSEPPRRSARIANLLKKSDPRQEAKKEKINSTRPRARSRAVSRARDTASRASLSESKYKTFQTGYKASSVAPSGYSFSSSRDLHNRGTKKENRYPHRSSTEHCKTSTASSNDRNNDPQHEYYQPTIRSPATDERSFAIGHKSPAIAERSATADRSPTTDRIPSPAEISATNVRIPATGERIHATADRSPAFTDRSVIAERSATAESSFAIGHKSPASSDRSVITERSVAADRSVVTADTSPTTGDTSPTTDTKTSTPDRSPEDPNVLIEEPSHQEDVENHVVDIVNRMEDVVSDYSRQLDEYQEGTNAYYINNDSLFSRREPSNYINDNNAYRNNGSFSPYGLPARRFDGHDNLRQGFDSSIPFHRRQMVAHDTFNNIPDFSSPAGFPLYEPSSWPAPHNERAHYQVSSWQTAYNDRLLMQNNFWNNNMFSSTQILCPDGGVLCVNENIYCLNRRVSLNNDYGT
ncbi:serine/arginine repetitive matrix protein 4 isoform X3 [Halyomorpha halys]|uniref:serine/arginine repetitive matrix protein 4 isoform X3 n=1 Tax=Halyomorpha halys TaxID=286706 RepID=UPI0006D50E47